jgi:hypothetical protein
MMYTFIYSYTNFTFDRSRVFANSEAHLTFTQIRRRDPQATSNVRYCKFAVPHKHRRYNWWVQIASSAYAVVIENVQCHHRHPLIKLYWTAWLWIKLCRYTIDYFILGILRFIILLCYAVYETKKKIIDRFVQSDSNDKLISNNRQRKENAFTVIYLC